MHPKRKFLLWQERDGEFIELVSKFYPNNIILRDEIHVNFYPGPRIRVERNLMSEQVLSN